MSQSSAHKHHTSRGRSAGSVAGKGWNAKPAILSQALHHADDPGRAVAEAARIVRPTGRVLVVDLRAHDEQWVQERLGDRWLGFTDAKLAELMRGGGLTDVTVQVGAHLSGDPFTVLLASGVRAPAREARTPVRRRKATPAA